MATVVDLEAGPDRQRAEAEVHPYGFDGLHAAMSGDIGRAFAIAIDDAPLAQRALERSLSTIAGGLRGDRSGASTPQQLWSHAFRWLTEARWPRSTPEFEGPVVLPRSSGRPLTDAIVSLPIRQRSTLVCRSVLGWSAAETARAHGVPASTVELRQQRALGELRKVLELDSPIELDAIRDELDSLEIAPVDFDDAPTSRGRARRRTTRARALAAGAVVAAIGLIGVGIQVVPDQAEVVETGPATVDPPRETEHPYVPISDDAGGFVAFGRDGGLISTSPDGTTWFPRSRLNVNRIDLRLFVERFFRSDDRYLMLIDSKSGGTQSFSGNDRPRLAVSENLVDWTFLRLDIEPPAPVDGLDPQLDLLGATALGDRYLVAVRIDQAIDHRRLGVVQAEICTTTDDQAGLVLHLCDGERIVVAEADPLRSGPADDIRLYASDDGGTFERLATDNDFNPWGMFAFEDTFAMLDPATRHLLISDDGVDWEPFFDVGIDNRLGLATGTPDGALVIAPAASGWRSTLLRDGSAISGSMPIDIDPTSIWIRPELVAGPAGWALFLTTSRPWERTNRGPQGWAVHTGDWIVEQRPELESIRLRSTTENLTYEYHHVIADGEIVLDHPTAQRNASGDVVLVHPASGETLVDVSAEQIEASWITGGIETGDERGPQSATKALVLFSPDGVNWDVVWSSERDTWYGSVAVGDDEVLVASSGLAGGPERITVSGD